MIYVKQITTQAEQDGEMNQMTLPYRHRVRNLSPGDLKRIIYVSVTEPELPPPNTASFRAAGNGKHIILYYILFSLKLEYQSVSRYLLHQSNGACIYADHFVIDG